jgi:cytochrome bd ubiquinol oxidase subunit I
VVSAVLDLAAPDAADEVVLRAAAVARPAAVITMEAGISTEVGRQRWIVYNLMKVEDAVTPNTGVWITFFAAVIL